MKTFLVLFTFVNILFNTTLIAQEYKVIDEVMIVDSNKCYCMLSDSSVWIATSFQVRERTFCEWWNGVTLNVPKMYETSFDRWKMDRDILICDSKDFINYEQKQICANWDELLTCKKVFVNARNGEVIFVKHMLMQDFMTHFYNDAYKVGYDKGLSDGYGSGYNAGYMQGINQK